MLKKCSFSCGRHISYQYGFNSQSGSSFKIVLSYLLKPEVVPVDCTPSKLFLWEFNKIIIIYNINIALYLWNNSKMIKWIRWSLWKDQKHIVCFFMEANGVIRHRVDYTHWRLVIRETNWIVIYSWSTSSSIHTEKHSWENLCFLIADINTDHVTTLILSQQLPVTKGYISDIVQIENWNSISMI